MLSFEIKRAVENMREKPFSHTEETGLSNDALAFIAKGGVLLEEHESGRRIYIESPAFAFFPANLPYTSHWSGDEIRYFSVFFEVKHCGREVIDRSEMRELKLAEPESCSDIMREIALSSESSESKELKFLPVMTELVSMLKTEGSNLISPFTAEAKGFIESHVCENFSVENMARALKVSTSTLLHRFGAETGKSVVEYRNYLRMQKAVELLRDTDMSTEEMSELLGFSSAPYFMRMFKKITGNTTKYYRKRNLL